MDNAYQVAVAEWQVFPRRLSTMIKNAGLGITGVGVTERYEIRYKPGEEVTEERVLKALQHTITQMNANNPEFEIRYPKVVSITKVI
jgi:hypothetical protein